jgi:subtilase family serine protease
VTLAVRADGALLRAPILPVLATNQITEHCVLRAELPAQQHQLSFAVDEPQQMFEMSKANNRYEMTIPARAATSAASVAIPSPEPKPSGDKPESSGAPAEPSGAQADLIVRGIRVNGQSPDGKDDCKVGKNAMTMVVKNNGKGDAASFAVRLTVDGNDLDATVDNLDAGQEREVGFEDVQLKSGEHTLKAVADAEHAIGESKEENNELKVTARCQG